MRAKEVRIDVEKMSVTVPVEKGKITLLVIDGNQIKAKITEAVEHGMTMIETVNGKAARLHYDEKEKF